MQILIVTLLLIAACIYLTWKWMPKMRRQQLQAWLNHYLPRLARFSAASGSGCGGGCSSCNQCATPLMPPAGTEVKKVIVLHQR